MILLFDENLPVSAVDSLQALPSIEARHTTEELHSAATDQQIFAFLRTRPQWYLVTQDLQITRRPHEIAAYHAAKVGAFILTGRAHKTAEVTCGLILRSIGAMRRIASEESKPFVFSITDNAAVNRIRVRR